MELRSLTAKSNGKTAAYELSAVVPTKLIPPLLELLAGHSVRIHSQASGLPHEKPTGREVILTTLRLADGELYRGELRKALAASGHTPSSVGPLCTALQQEGRISSPRRGFWQLNGSV